MRDKILSLLLVLFVAGVNALTACGQIPYSKPKHTTEETATVQSKSVTSDKQQMKDKAAGSEPKSNQKQEKEPEPENMKVSTKKITTDPDRQLTTETVEKPSVSVIWSDYGSPTAPTVQLENAELECQPTSWNLTIGLPQTVPVEEAKAADFNFLETSVQTSQYIEENSIPEEPQPINEGLILDPVSEHTHSYLTNTIEPTCTTGGYTLYSCVCGDSYRADETSALGHDWLESSERVNAGQEAHEICGDCGMDLTANGITGAGISDHAKNHVLSDENASGRTYTAMIDVYQDIIRYTCSRCGATQ